MPPRSYSGRCQWPDCEEWATEIVMRGEVAWYFCAEHAGLAEHE